MEWETTFLPDQQIIVIQTYGVVDEAGSIEMAKGIFNAMQAHNALRCLIDHSAIESASGSITRIYYRPQELRRAGVPSNVKIAEVVLPAYKEHFGFLETVLHNHGFNFRIFQEREPAMEWLML